MIIALTIALFLLALVFSVYAHNKSVDHDALVFRVRQIEDATIGCKDSATTRSGGMRGDLITLRERVNEIDKHLLLNHEDVWRVNALYGALAGNRAVGSAIRAILGHLKLKLEHTPAKDGAWVAVPIKPAVKGKT